MSTHSVKCDEETMLFPLQLFFRSVIKKREVLFELTAMTARW